MPCYFIRTEFCLLGTHEYMFMPKDMQHYFYIAENNLQRIRRVSSNILTEKNFFFHMNEDKKIQIVYEIIKL